MCMDQPLFIRQCTRGVKICCSFKCGVVYEPPKTVGEMVGWCHPYCRNPEVRAKYLGQSGIQYGRTSSQDDVCPFAILIGPVSDRIVSYKRVTSAGQSEKSGSLECRLQQYIVNEAESFSLPVQPYFPMLENVLRTWTYLLLRPTSSSHLLITIIGQGEADWAFSYMWASAL